MRLGGLALLALMLSGCGATLIVPPESPRDPVPVFVLDHGRHTSLVVSAADGSLHRYAYGDWRYYAERDTSLWNGLSALLWPTPGALGYRRLPGPPETAAVLGQVGVPIVELHSLHVERAGVEALRSRLDTLIAQADTWREAPEVELLFVPYPRRYSLAHSSNQVLADWLGELGCEVSRRPVLSSWQLQASPKKAHPDRGD